MQGRRIFSGIMTIDQKTNSRLPILFIENDADTCQLIKFVFGEAGWQIEICERTKCLKTIRLNNFAAIILDNYFGDLSGAEICAEVRKFDRKIPVVIFSGESRKPEIKKALAAGANDYLVKPHDFEQLLPTVIKLIQSNQN